MQNAQVLYTFFLFAPNLASCLVYFFVFLHSFSSFSACFSFERCILYKLCSFSNKFSNFGNIFVVFLSLHFIFVRYRIQWNHQFEWFRMYTMCIERLVARTKQKSNVEYSHQMTYQKRRKKNWIYWNQKFKKREKLYPISVQLSFFALPQIGALHIEFVFVIFLLFSFYP